MKSGAEGTKGIKEKGTEPEAIDVAGLLESGGEVALSRVAAERGGDIKNPHLGLKNLKILAEGPLGSAIDEILRLAIGSPSLDDSLNCTEQIVGALASTGEEGLSALDLFLNDRDEGGGVRYLPHLMTLTGSSPYLSGIITGVPDNFRWLFIEKNIEVSKEGEPLLRDLSELAGGCTTLEELKKVLRRFKRREYLRVGLRDLTGLAGVREVTREISDIARAALQVGLDFILSDLKRRHGAPTVKDEKGEEREAAFGVIGMGKLGGRELNFSSDIDLIYICSEDGGETEGDSEGRRAIPINEFFTKAGRTLTEVINASTEDGNVFRVDLDLRPDGSSGPLVNSLHSMETYYESWGRTWERSALIKGRLVASSPKGDTSLEEDFESIITPFVYRRYLDFTAIDEIRLMKEKIDLHLLKRRRNELDVKLGAGGIREIEFFCQGLQLINGGRDSSLRVRSTLKALPLLAEKGHISEDYGEALSRDYKFLRNIEHRLQIVEGRQTQVIPVASEEVVRLSRMMGYRDEGRRAAREQFWGEFLATTDRVYSIYRTLFYSSEEELDREVLPDDVLLIFSPDESEEDKIERLGRLGFITGRDHRDGKGDGEGCGNGDDDREAREIYKKALYIVSGPPHIRLTERVQILLEKIGPTLLHLASNTPDPPMALNHTASLLSSVGSRASFYSLLYENPPVLETITSIFGTSIFLSRAIIDHPENLDSLLSMDLTGGARSVTDLAEGLRGELTPVEGDYEGVMAVLRRFKGEELLRIGIRDILSGRTYRDGEDVKGEDEGPIPSTAIKEVTAEITNLGRVILNEAVRAATCEVSIKHGPPLSEWRFGVLGLGKFGAGELIYGSDLDIIFLYDGDPASTTSGRKEVSPREFYMKVAQRIISLLTLSTKEGVCFEIDTRLRPSGSSGPLVVSRKGLLDYNSKDRAIWERQAMTRAEAAAGDMDFTGEVLKELDELTFKGGLSSEDLGEMRRIRERMEVEIGQEREGRYNIKTGRGGIVDIEFLVQKLLLEAGTVTLKEASTRRAVEGLTEAGRLAEAEGELLTEAYDLYRSIEISQRIIHDRPEGTLVKGSTETEVIARRLGYASSDELIDRYIETSGHVRELFNIKMR